MNLVTDLWIPVLHKNGDRRLASLQQVFTEGCDYSDLAVRPHERIALMRLLIAIAQSALDGPKDIDEWDCAMDGLSGDATQYFHEWKDSFDLFHTDRPFLQITGLSKPKKDGDATKEGEALTSVTKLDFALATGNNTTLFDHGANSRDSRSFPSFALPLMLITYLCFSPGGRIAWLDWNGKPRPIPAGKGEKSKNSSKHAPCIPGSMLHTFVRRPTVLETIHANLLTREDATYQWGEDSWGKPVWEWMPDSWDDERAVQNATRTYLGRMVPLSRLVKLNRDGTNMWLGNGFDYPAFDGKEIPAEPSATVVLGKKGGDRTILGAGEKAIWRELSALIIRRRQNAIGGPLTLRNIPEDKDFDIWVGAFLTSKASIDDTVESVLHVPATMQSQIGRGAYDNEVKHAEFVANRLGWAVETWREHEDGGWKGRVETTKPQDRWKLKDKLRGIATKHFWTTVEELRPLLLALVEALGTTAEVVEESRAVWRKAVWAAAFDAYRLTCSQETPRQIRAYALGLGRLTGENNKGEQHAEREPETMEA